MGNDYAAEPAPADGTAIISGRLGIGTNNPQGVLHVVGVEGAQSNALFLPGVGGTLNVGIGTTAPFGELEVVSTTSSDPARGITSTQISSGIQGALVNVRKARGTPSSLSAVASGDYGGAFLSYNYDGSSYLATAGFGTRVNGTVSEGSVPTDLFFYTSGGANDTDPYSNSHVRLVIDNNGNVGIGTAAPTQRLHVAGTVRIVDGTQAAGRVLTSDANGVASWQAAPGAPLQGVQVGAAQTFNNPGNATLTRVVNINGFAGATFVQLSSELESLEPNVISSASILFNFRNAANITILSFPFRLRGGDVDTALDHDSILVPLPVNATSIQIVLTGTHARNREQATLTFYR